MEANQKTDLSSEAMQLLTVHAVPKQRQTERDQIKSKS